MSTPYPVPEEQGEESVYRVASRDLLRDTAIVKVNPRRFVFIWAETEGNEEYNTVGPYVAGVSGYVENDLSISWEEPKVIFEEEEEPVVGVNVDIAPTKNGFFLLINEFVASSEGGFYALRGVLCSVDLGGTISVTSLQDIEPPTDDDNLRIREPALGRFSESVIGVFYATENSSNAITEMKTRLINISGIGFSVGSVNTHSIGTDVLNFEPVTVSPTHGILRYRDDNNYSIRIMERSGGSFNFGSQILFGDSLTRLSRVNDTTFAQAQGEEIRILEIDPIALNIETTGSYVNWYPFDITSARKIFNIKDDQLLVFAVAGGTLRSNGVSVNGTVATVPEDFVDLGPTEGIGFLEEDSALLGYGLIVANFDTPLDSFEEEIGAFAISYSGAFTPSTTLYMIGTSISGSIAYVTAWADDLLVLNVISLATGGQIDSIFLGVATLNQVTSKTFIAYPCTAPGSLYIYGRINTNIGIIHVMQSNDGGSNFEVIENNWGTDFAGSMICRGVDDFYVMRCNSNSSRLYQSTPSGLIIRSTLPFSGPVTPHGMRFSYWDESIVAGVEQTGEPLTVVFSTPPHLSWEDITNNHPQTAVNAVVPL